MKILRWILFPIAAAVGFTLATFLFSFFLDWCPWKGPCFYNTWFRANLSLSIIFCTVSGFLAVLFGTLAAPSKKKEVAWILLHLGCLLSVYYFSKVRSNLWTLELLIVPAAYFGGVLAAWLACLSQCGKITFMTVRWAISPLASALGYLLAVLFVMLVEYWCPWGRGTSGMCSMLPNWIEVYFGLFSIFLAALFAVYFGTVIVPDKNDTAVCALFSLVLVLALAEALKISGSNLSQKGFQGIGILIFSSIYFGGAFPVWETFRIDARRGGNSSIRWVLCPLGIIEALLALASVYILIHK